MLQRQEVGCRVTQLPPQQQQVLLGLLEHAVKESQEELRGVKERSVC
jgi:hypothetical protein